MKLGKIYGWYYAFLMLVIGANGFLMLMVKQAHESVVATQEYRQKALELTEGLHDETDQLAHLVRVFTVTGEMRYLRFYYDIIAIRQGEKPVPENYNPSTYWDEAIAGRISGELPSEGVKKSLLDHMKSLNFAKKEFAALEKVLAISEELQKIEQIAFAATQGLYDPDSGEFISDGRPQLAFARKIVNGDQYNQLKADMSVAIQNLITTTKKRTRKEMREVTENLEQLIWMSVVSLFITFWLILLASQIMRYQVLRPITLLGQVARRLANGDYSARVREAISVLRPNSASKCENTQINLGVEEINALGNTLDSMAEAIEDDIHAKAEVQKVLEAARKQAEEGTQAKSMFLANMSHEIRTPMNAIIGMSYLALQSGLSGRQHDYVSKVYNAAKSLLGIINDILDFTKIEAGKLTLEESRFRLEDVVGNTLLLLRQRAAEKEVELLLDMADISLHGESGTFLGDPLRLGQVLLNLLSNALKFTHQGYVKLSVAIEERGQDSTVLRFVVQDTGIGMTSAQMANLFREFSQADGSTTRKYGGTGLGLTISKRLIDLMGGSIQVESVSGEGSSFSFWVRLSLAKENSLPVKMLPGTHDLRVLVADDQPEACQVVANMLMTLGVGAAHAYGIDCAKSGAAALAMIHDAGKNGQPYDILFLDWLMPDMDGKAVLQKLADCVEIRCPTTVIVSAYDSEMIHEIAERLGSHNFLPKPVLPGMLRNFLNSMTGNTVDEPERGYLVQSLRCLAGMRVLLAEDNPINQQLAIDLLHAQDVHVDVANNGQEAVEKVQSMPEGWYHAVLMDLQMPVMDGYKATRLLRADPRYDSLPILAMTAHAFSEERDRCLALGMNEHVSKPFEPDDLYAVLARYYTPSLAVSAPMKIPKSNTSSQMIELPAISGLDTSVGLGRCGGNATLYLQLLENFCNDYAEAQALFEQSFAGEHWLEAERLAHTLKGLAGTLGAKSIQDKAQALEAACKSNDKQNAYAALMPLTKELTPLLENLKLHLERREIKPVDKETTAVPDSDLADTLLRLRHLLAECDSDSINLWEAHKSEFVKLLPTQTIQQISTALRNIDFDRALELLPADVHNSSADDSTVTLEF